jgi:hypothetical protein
MARVTIPGMSLSWESRDLRSAIGSLIVGTVVEAAGPFYRVVTGPSILARWRRPFLFRQPRPQTAHEKWRPSRGPLFGDRSKPGTGRITDAGSFLRESLVILSMKELDIWPRCDKASMHDDGQLGRM